MGYFKIENKLKLVKKDVKRLTKSKVCLIRHAATMTVWTKKLTSLRCLAGSRYQSLYRQISENQHKNLVGLAHELHNQDREKYNEFKPFGNPQFDLKNDKKQLRDWIEIHDTTINLEVQSFPITHQVLFTCPYQCTKINLVLHCG